MVFDHIERDVRMSIGAARTHFGRDPNRLHDLPRRGAVLQSCSRMTANAVWTLRDVRNGDRDQLLRQRGQRAVGENAPCERAKRFGLSGLDRKSASSRVGCG
jgi:hypothetical protein